MRSYSFRYDPKCGGRLSGQVCVSVFGRNVSELKSRIAQARLFKPKYIELRLDYLSRLPDSISRLSDVFVSSDLIWTLRSCDEGGKSRISDNARRQAILEIISGISPAMIDIEINTLEAFPEVYCSQKNSKTMLIASSHDFQKTQKLEDLERLVIDAKRKYSPNMIKVVRKANDFGDNFTILSLYRLVDQIKPTKLIAFCMGPFGIFSRIACVSFGSPFTFAALPDKSTAPGQLDISSVNSLLASW